MITTDKLRNITNLIKPLAMLLNEPGPGGIVFQTTFKNCRQIDLILKEQKIYYKLGLDSHNEQPNNGTKIFYVSF